MATIGELKEIPWFVIQWKIQQFPTLSSKEDEFYSSPLFCFAGASWYLTIYPNGQTKINLENGGVGTSIGYIDVYLNRKSSGSPINVEYIFDLKTTDDKIHSDGHLTYLFKKAERYGYRRYLKRSVLLENYLKNVPSGEFSVICKMKYPKSDRITNTESLCEDYKKILLDGKIHDIILKVRDKELRAHQDILRARSRVFESMFSHDMMEKNNGFIDIPDCDYQAMEIFLSYVYTGKVEILDQSNMLNLYYVADKYEMKHLKEICCEYIKQSLSFTNICDVIQLATNHSDSILLDYSTEYFMNNVFEIMQTLEWQSFLKENSTVGNELLIKSVKKLKNISN